MENKNERNYETIVLFDPMLNDAALKAEMQKVQSLIEANSGSIKSVNSWGKKEVGHAIRKNKFATYVQYEFASEEGGTVSKVGNTLRMTESVLSFQTHRNMGTIRKYKGNKRALERSKDMISSLDDDTEF